MDTWIETSEQYDVIISLDEVLHQIERVAEGDINAWKWAIVALTCSINGALTCLLSGTMNIGALRDDDVRQSIAAHEQGSNVKEPERPQLAKPDILLKRARRGDLRKEHAGPVLTLTPCQTFSFKKLVRLRNSFLHFEPMGWVIETRGMTSIFEQVLTIIDQVVDDKYWAFRHTSEEDHEHLVTVSKDIRNVLSRIADSH